MIKQFTLSVALITALSGCATMQHAQSQKLVIPATVLTETPVNHVAVGLFASRQKGVDVIVKTETKPSYTISIVQPAINSRAVHAGQQVKLIFRINSNHMRVIK